MAGLRDTTAFLKQMRQYASVAPQGGSPQRCEEVPSFGANPGHLRMLAYRPNGLPEGAPLVVAMHGCTQTGEAYASAAGWLDLADQLGFAVVAPEQGAQNNPNRCFNWFSAEDITRGRGECASIAAMVQHAVKAWGLDADRVFITGLSAGGAMTAVMLATYPELFAGGAIIAGLPFGSAVSLPDALKAMQAGDARSEPDLARAVLKAAEHRRRPVRLSIWHGDADTTVHPGNGRALARQWTQAAGLTGDGHIERARLYSRQVWEGDSVVELVTVPGLGHGTPLSTHGPEGLGAAAPFMLDIGLGSTRHTASFWGLEKATGYHPAAKAATSGAETAPRSMAPFPDHGVGGKVQDVINKALRSAGLMK